MSSRSSNMQKLTGQNTSRGTFYVGGGGVPRPDLAGAGLAAGMYQWNHAVKKAVSGHEFNHGRQGKNTEYSNYVNAYTSTEDPGKRK